MSETQTPYWEKCKQVYENPPSQEVLRDWYERLIKSSYPKVEYGDPINGFMHRKSDTIRLWIEDDQVRCDPAGWSWKEVGQFVDANALLYYISKKRNPIE